jgi:hypothetical protein
MLTRVTRANFSHRSLVAQHGLLVSKAGVIPRGCTGLVENTRCGLANLRVSRRKAAAPDAAMESAHLRSMPKNCDRERHRSIHHKPI